MRLKKDLIRPPVLRVKVGEQEERHATWLELFYDLVFVGAIAQVTGLLAANYSLTGLMQFAALCIPIWWAWVGHTFYLTRFDSDDVVHRLMTMAQMIMVAIMAIHIPQAFNEGSTGFALSYVAVRLLLVLEYVRAGWLMPIVRALTTRYALGFSIAASFWVVSIFIEGPWKFLLCGIGLLIDFGTPLTSGSLHIKFPPHLTHLPERFGLFTIIVIGEAVIAGIASTDFARLNLNTAITAFMGMVIAFAFWWAYFDSIRASDERPLASRSHVKRYQLWLYSHLPLMMSIVATAAGIKWVIKQGPETVQPLPQMFILSSLLGFGMLAMNLIFTTGQRDMPVAMFRMMMIPHYAVAFLTVVSGLVALTFPALAVTGTLSLLCVLQVLFSLREPPTEPLPPWMRG